MYEINRVACESLGGGNVYAIRFEGDDKVWRITDDFVCCGVNEVAVKVGEKVLMHGNIYLECMPLPNHEHHCMFRIENNLFIGVADSRELGMKDICRGCNIYPGRGPSLILY